MDLIKNLHGFLMWERNSMKLDNKNCTDCLHCKVSVKSAENNRLCYCAVRNKEQRHKETFWLEKKVCSRFEDMVENMSNRRPLMRKRV